MAGDLHAHTTFSDAGMKIEDLLQFADDINLSYLAVTDHDTFLAYDYCSKVNSKYKVKLLPSVEISCMDHIRNQPVHLLCYLPDKTPELIAQFEKMKTERNEVIYKSIEGLREIYPCFSQKKLDILRADSDITFKAHVMKLLIEYGYTTELYGELFRSLLGSNGRFPSEPVYPDFYDILKLVKQANAVAILAHPTVYNSMELAQKLAQNHLIDGFEIDHPRNTDNDKIILRKLCSEYNLIATAGSDFHGSSTSKPVPLGSHTMSDTQVEKIIKLAQSRKKGNTNDTY